MYPSLSIYEHRNQDIAARLERIDATEYVRKFLMLSMRTAHWLRLHPTTFTEAEQVRDYLNDPKNTASKSMRDLRGFYYWDQQRVDFLPSNLGERRGYVFYFKCNGCRQRVKYLYLYTYCETPLCRSCCRLGYRAPNRRARQLSRLLRKPYYSDDVKRAIIEHAGITKEDLARVNL